MSSRVKAMSAMRPIGSERCSRARQAGTCRFDGHFGGRSSSCGSAGTSAVIARTGVTSTAPAAEPAAPKTYTVASGDSLSKIAKKVLGNANRWREIFDANRDQIDNPDLIQPGQVLKLPADTASKA